MKKHLTVIFVAFLMLGLAVPYTAMGATENGEGQDRTVTLELSGTNYTSTANVSAPTDIAENHTWTANVEYNLTGDAITTTNWLNVTLMNDSVSESFSSGSFELSENGTVDVQWDSDFKEQDNVTVDLTFENTDGKSDSWSGESNVVSNSVFAIRDTLSIIVQLIPIIVIVAFVLPVIFGMLKDIGDEF